MLWFSMKTYDVSIIIPCYNEEAILEEGVREIEEVMNQTKYRYELIFVDDCSIDGTGDCIKEIIRDKSNMQYISHEKNTGKGGSILDGIKSSTGNIVGFLDIDLEVHARYLPMFISAVDEGHDVITGRRIYTLVPTIHNISRYFMSMVYGVLVRHYLGLPFRDLQCGFKFFNRESILPLIEKTEESRWLWDTEILALAHQHNKRVKEISCVFRRRRDKKSSLNPWRDTWGMLKGLRKLKKKISV